MTFYPKDNVSVVICGEAGQGIQTVETILVQALKRSGYHIFSTKEYMSRVRGGYNSTQIRVSSHRVSSYVNRIDILFVLSSGAIKHLEDKISPDTFIIGDPEHFKSIKENNTQEFQHRIIQELMNSIIFGDSLIQTAQEMGA